MTSSGWRSNRRTPARPGGFSLGIDLIVVVLAAAAMQAQPANSPIEEAAALARLRSASQTVPAGTPAWKTRQVPNPAQPWLRMEVYSAEEVKADLATAKQRLLEAAGDNRVLRAYIASAIPSGGSLAAGGGVVAKEEADRAWDRTSRLARALGTLSSTSVDLEVISLPDDGAAFRLTAVAVDEVRETLTNGTFRSVWRGLYRYEGRIQGVVRWRGPLDLVQERGSRLVCNRPPLGESDEAVPCRLEDP